jgi:hypothetical protein
MNHLWCKISQLQQPLPTLATNHLKTQIKQAKTNVSAGHVEASAIQVLEF